MIIWLIASAAALETFLQFMDYVISRNLAKAGLWLADSAGLFLLALVAEKFKAAEERF